MKYIKFLLLFILLVSSVVITVCAEEVSPKVTLKVNGTKIQTDVPPVIINGRTFVPIRAISELNEATIRWDGVKKIATIRTENVEIKLTIGSKTALLNGKEVELDEGATIISDRTMVPVRFVAQSFGYTVDWDDNTKTVKLISPQKEEEPEAGKTARLSTIGSANTDKGYRITIKFKSPMPGEYNIFELDNPSRVIIDVENADIDYTTKFDFSNETVKSARAGNHDSYLRIVIDLKEFAEYTTYVNPAKDALVLFFDVKSSEPQIKDETQSPAQPEEEEDKPGIGDKDGKITVVIDPGHGGSDPGALGKEDGKVVAYEDDINLAVSLHVRDILEENGINVIMTRDESVRVSLGGRCEISNEAEADLFVSIHSNAMEEGKESVNGTMVFFGQSKDKEEPWVLSKKLASNILTRLTEALDTADLGLQNGDQLAVIRGTVAPAVLVELAFITNPEDREKLLDEDYQYDAGKAIAEGILKTIGKI